VVEPEKKVEFDEAVESLFSQRDIIMLGTRIKFLRQMQISFYSINHLL